MALSQSTVVGKDVERGAEKKPPDLGKKSRVRAENTRSTTWILPKGIAVPSRFEVLPEVLESPEHWEDPNPSEVAPINSKGKSRYKAKKRAKAGAILQRGDWDDKDVVADLGSTIDLSKQGRLFIHTVIV